MGHFHRGPPRRDTDWLRHGPQSDGIELVEAFFQGAAYGPHRYLTLRRLMLHGLPLADSAAHAGFADQPHLTRHFSAAYGISPARWLRLNRRA